MSSNVINEENVQQPLLKYTQQTIYFQLGSSLTWAKLVSTLLDADCLEETNLKRTTSCCLQKGLSDKICILLKYDID